MLNTRPKHYIVTIKKRSNNIYLINPSNIDDFFVFNGEPEEVHEGQILQEKKLIKCGRYASINGLHITHEKVLRMAGF